MNRFKIKMGDPICVSYCPRVYKYEWEEWGMWNFPFLERTKEGYIHCSFSLHEDDITSYGTGDIAHFISKDEGLTWERCPKDVGYTGGLELADGSRIRACSVPALDPRNYPSVGEPDYSHTWEIPEPDMVNGVHAGSVDMLRTHHFYLLARLPEEFRTWGFSRKTEDGPWQIVNQLIPMPENTVLFASTNRYDYSTPVMVARYFFEKVAVAPDGRVWGYFYPSYATGNEERVVEPRPTFFVSEDNGNTFHYLSQIPFTPDPRFPEGKQYPNMPLLGFTEPHIEFLPNGTVVCLLRTHDGPDTTLMSSYICYSYDNGKTWTKPEVFDELGVFPQLLHLNCGVTLASYGRPRIYIRATDDPEAKVWQSRICVLDQNHSCSYTGLLALDDHSALLVYTDATYKQADGKPHKSVLVRKIEVVTE